MSSTQTPTIPNPSSSEAASPWRGAPLPKGCSDVTEMVDIRGCDLLNADDDAGSVRVLFDPSKPSALSTTTKTSEVADKDWVESGTDDQLLLFMPFNSALKVHTIQITSIPPAQPNAQNSDSDDDDDDAQAPMRPAEIRLYTNQSHNLDFSEADDTPPVQTISLAAADWNADGTATLGLRYVRFQNISSLVLYVTRGDGDGETVRLDRVRLLGESGEKRQLGKLEKIDDDHE